MRPSDTKDGMSQSGDRPLCRNMMYFHNRNLSIATEKTLIKFSKQNVQETQQPEQLFNLMEELYQKSATTTILSNQWNVIKAETRDRNAYDFIKTLFCKPQRSTTK